MTAMTAMTATIMAATHIQKHTHWFAATPHESTTGHQSCYGWELYLVAKFTCRPTESVNPDLAWPRTTLERRTAPDTVNCSIQEDSSR